MASAQEYYPFGMPMPGRKFTTAIGYRYGFNGKEEDDEVKGDGNQQDYGMRYYDPRLGRFLSVDPITKKYPELTPYQFASNSPVAGVDLDGLEFYFAADGNLIGQSTRGGTQIRVATEYHANPNNLSQNIITKYVDIDKVSLATAGKVFKTIFNREIKGNAKDVIAIRDIGRTGLGAETNPETKIISVNIASEKNGELLNKDYNAVATNLYHENFHNKGLANDNGFSHFDIQKRTIENSGFFNKTSSNFKEFMKSTLSDYLGEQSQIIQNQIVKAYSVSGKEFDGWKYSVNAAIKKYNENVKWYNKKFKENRSLGGFKTFEKITYDNKKNVVQ